MASCLSICFRTWTDSSRGTESLPEFEYDPKEICEVHKQEGEIANRIRNFSRSLFFSENGKGTLLYDYLIPPIFFKSLKSPDPAKPLKRISQIKMFDRMRAIIQEHKLNLLSIPDFFTVKRFTSIEKPLEEQYYVGSPWIENLLTTTQQELEFSNFSPELLGNFFRQIALLIRYSGGNPEDLRLKKEGAQWTSVVFKEDSTDLYVLKGEKRGSKNETIEERANTIIKRMISEIEEKINSDRERGVFFSPILRALRKVQQEMRREIILNGTTPLSKIDLPNLIFRAVCCCPCITKQAIQTWRQADLEDGAPPADQEMV